MTLSDDLRAAKGLTKDQRAFLLLLSDAPKPRGQLPIASREQDKVRQQCRRLGYAEYCGGYLNGTQQPMGWRITDAGRRAISTSEAQE